MLPPVLFFQFYLRFTENVTGDEYAVAVPVFQFYLRFTYIHDFEGCSVTELALSILFEIHPVIRSLSLTEVHTFNSI